MAGLSFDDIHKDYGHVLALRGLDLEVEDGELMVVGPDLDRAKRMAPQMVPAIWPGHGSDGPGGHKWPHDAENTPPGSLVDQATSKFGRLGHQ